MILPRQNGRELLLEEVRRMLQRPASFTLAEALDVFQKSFERYQIEQTGSDLIFVAHPKGRLQRRYFDVALCRSLVDEGEWEEPPGQIQALLKVPCGFASHLLPKTLLTIGDGNVHNPNEFFESVRRTRIFRWYGANMPIECELKLWGGDEFFEMAAIVLPKLKEAGILTCDSCSINGCSNS